MTGLESLSRRQLLLRMGGTGAAVVLARSSGALAQIAANTVSAAQFGARSDAADNTQAIQAAIAAVERTGGGTVVIPGRYRCGNLVVSGNNVRIQGQSGWLVDGRLTIAPGATNTQVADIGIIDTKGDRRAFLLDVSGQACSFDNVQLVKDPIAGGVQMYLRQSASGCRFTGLRLKGSNGIILAGRDHLFDGFELESTMVKGMGGDDAFAIKAPNTVTENITIRNGVIRGFGAMVSFGSEIGAPKGIGGKGAVRNVTVENVTGDRCVRLAFFKPGGLKYDYRDGLVEHVVFRNVSLSDPDGDYFRTGIYMIAGRGAVIRDIQASGVKITARARDRGVATTSAVQLLLMGNGAPAIIEDVDLQVQFVDPYSGAPNGPNAPGYPVDYIAQFEKRNPDAGSISNVVLDLDARGSALGGVLVGPGLDGAIDLKRARLIDVATDPKAKAGAAGIWSQSRVILGDVEIQAAKAPKFGGRAFTDPSQ